MIVASLLGLAEAVLALDLDVVETLFEGENARPWRAAARRPRW
jgi:hypothetical protein